MPRMLQFYFYVPESHLEQVKEAVFDAGAGRIGDYEACCWQTLGKGQFRPGDAANPFIGRKGELETVEEWRVEMVLPETLREEVLQAFRRAHPYEEPAYGFIAIET